MKPLAPLFDDIVAARMGTTSDMRDGFSYNGRLTYVPPTGEARYQALVDYADANGLLLRESVAYADSASDLPMLEAVGFPVGSIQRPSWHHRSQARLLIEDFRKSGGAPRKLLPIAPMRDRCTDKALVFERKLAKFAAATVAGRFAPGSGAKFGPLKLKDLDVPDLLGPEWQIFKPRLSGICGSDLATIDGQSSRYFEPIVSFPFVPGHEVVGDLADGSRAVLVPLCTARCGIEPVCQQCPGTINPASASRSGISLPLAVGFCRDTGRWRIAIRAQDHLFAIPRISPTRRVMIVLRHAQYRGPQVHAPAVVTGGHSRLLTVAALRCLRQVTTHRHRNIAIRSPRVVPRRDTVRAVEPPGVRSHTQS